MISPFASAIIWQQGTFNFFVITSPSLVSADIRGTPSEQGTVIALTFKLKPNGGNVQQLENGDKSTVSVQARLVSINGDYEKFKLPNSIKPGDIGEGSIGDRRCRAVIKSLVQSSVAPIVEKILGSSLLLELDFRTYRGNSS